MTFVRLNWREEPKMLPSNGNGNAYIKYRENNNIDFYTNGEVRVTVNDSGLQATDLAVTNNATITGNTTITGDVNAAGGFAQTLLFFRNNPVQNIPVVMTASEVYTTASLPGPVCYMQVPLVRAGSIRGISLCVMSPAQVVKSGAISASVLINDTKSLAASAIMVTGSVGTTTLAKDVVTFAAGSRLAVILSSSAGYLCEPDITSASFVCSVLLEM